MHDNILTKEQVELLPLIARFRRNFGLVGGTAIALHIGHRESIDFDLFTFEPFKGVNIRKRIEKHRTIDRTFVNRMGEYTIIINGVQMTFFHYPFVVPFTKEFEDVIKMPDLVTLAAMKAYALGQRSKWKDYIDLYFILRDHCSLEDVIHKGQEIFGPEFNPKIFRTQLAYFDDVSYAEEVVYKDGFTVADEEIKTALVEHSLS